MRLKLDATHEELVQKGGALVHTLARALAKAHPALSEALYKAAPIVEEESTHKVVRELESGAQAVYEHHMRLAKQRLDALLASRSKG